MDVFKILYDHFRNFIKEHPVVAFGFIIAALWLPMITSFYSGDFLTPMVNILVMEFPYVNIPLGFSLMFIAWVPLYFFYIKPHDEAVQRERMNEFAKAMGAKPKGPHSWMGK